MVYRVVGYYVTRECANCGILWCRRTPLCRRRTNRSVSGRVQALHYNTVHLMTTKMISQYRLLTSTKEGKYDGAVQRRSWKQKKWQFSVCFNLDSASVSLSLLPVAAVAIHRHRVVHGLGWPMGWVGSGCVTRNGPMDNSAPSCLHNLHWLHYAPPVTTRVAAIAPPKPHNLVHRKHHKNPATRYITVAHQRTRCALAVTSVSK